MLWGALKRIGTIAMSSWHAPADEGTLTVMVVGADEDAVWANLASVLPRAAGENVRSGQARVLVGSLRAPEM